MNSRPMHACMVTCTAKPSSRRSRGCERGPYTTLLARTQWSLRQQRSRFLNREERVKLTNLLVFPAILLLAMNTNADQSNLQSRAERTNYEETSRYADVIEFINALQQLSPAVKLEFFGVTNEGRAL